MAIVIIGTTALATLSIPYLRQKYDEQVSKPSQSLSILLWGPEEKQNQVSVVEDSIENKQVALVQPAEQRYLGLNRTTLGQYLETYSTKDTWFEKVQVYLGDKNPVPLTMLDAAYIGLGSIGFFTLSLGTTPALLVGAPLVLITAVGMKEQGKTKEILAGIGTGATLLLNPTAASYVLKEAYSSAKEVVKESVELAKTGIRLTPRFWVESVLWP
jgi:hypothetical protein